MAMTTHDALRALARRQHGVVSRQQLTELGFTRPAVGRAVASGHLERVTARVLRLGGSPSSAPQRALIAALDARGVVALYSAASMWHAPGFTLEPVHTLSTRRPHRDVRPTGRMHSSVRLEEVDITTLDGIPITTPVRTLLDLAGHIHPVRLSQLCDRMLTNRLLRLEVLHAMGTRLPPRGGAPGNSEFRKLLLARPEGYRPAESNLEQRFEWILKEAGERRFERQADVGDDDGWIGRVDFVDRDLRVIVEVQSALFHSGLVDRERDARRLARLRQAGWIVVEVTDHEVWHRKDLVIARIRTARAHARRPKVAPFVTETVTY